MALKKIATVEVHENKNVVKAHGFMSGDTSTPILDVRFKHLFGETNLSAHKLRWVIVDDVGSLVVGDTSITSDNTAEIRMPNELFEGKRRMKVQLTIATADGSRILNLQQFTDLEVVSDVTNDKVAEPIYKAVINSIYEETYKCKASLEEYLINAENGGNAQFLQGYSPSNFNKVEDNILMLTNSASSKYKLGDVVEVLGYYTAGDGAHHKRKIETTDDGSGVQCANGTWANIVHNGEVNVSWFGAKKTDIKMNLRASFSMEEIRNSFDSTVPFSKAISAVRGGGVLNIPKGIFVVDSNFLLDEPITIKGTGQWDCAIVNKNSEKFLFEASTKAKNWFSNFKLLDLTIFSKYGLKLVGTFFMFPTVKRVNFMGWTNLYENELNKNEWVSPYKNLWYTAELPTDEQLWEEGVSVYWGNAFDGRIEQCHFMGVGLGIKFRGADINLITNCRFSESSRHASIEFQSDGMIGSQTKIEKCDIMKARRYGGLFFSSWWCTINDNYFEDQTRNHLSPCYILTKGDRGTRIINNRFDANNGLAPMLDLTPAYDCFVEGNRFNTAGHKTFNKIIDTWQDTVCAVRVYWNNNSDIFPKPDVAHTCSIIESNLFRYNNYGNMQKTRLVNSIQWATGGPFTFDSFLKTYVVKTTNGPFEIEFDMEDKLKGKRNFSIKTTSAPNGSDYKANINIRYKSSSGETVTLNEWCSLITNKEQGLTENVQNVTIPEDMDTNGKFLILFENDKRKLYEIEIMPSDKDNFKPVNKNSFKNGYSLFETGCELKFIENQNNENTILNKNFKRVGDIDFKGGSEPYGKIDVKEVVDESLNEPVLELSIKENNVYSLNLHEFSQQDFDKYFVIKTDMVVLTAPGFEKKENSFNAGVGNPRSGNYIIDKKDFGNWKTHKAISRVRSDMISSKFNVGLCWSMYFPVNSKLRIRNFKIFKFDTYEEALLCYKI
ncbi:MAG: right-handed parallel beta-helix repeat-containing protein [Fusobacteriaceae bacterium]